MAAMSAGGAARPPGERSPPAATGVLATLAALLEPLGIRYQWRGGKLLLPAVWHGKTKLTVAVWPGGGWNNAARLGEHGNWRELLALLGLDQPDDQAALAQAVAQVDREALVQREATERRRRVSQAQAFHRRALSLDQRDNLALSGTGRRAVEHRRRQAQLRQQIAPARRYLEQRGLAPATVEAVARLQAPSSPGDSIIRYVDQGPLGGILLFPILKSTGFTPGQVIGVQRIFIDPQGNKRPGPGPDGVAKQMLGAATYQLPDSAAIYGGACWLHQEAQPGGLVILGEGPETGLACWQATDLDAIVGIHFSAHGLAHPDAALIRRLQPSQIIIAADNDESGTGLRAARHGAQQLHQAGLGAIAIALPPRDYQGQVVGNAKGSDWLDVLQRLGAPATGRLLRDSAIPYVPSPLDATLPRAPAPVTTPRAPVVSLARLRTTTTAPTPPAALPLAAARTANTQLIQQALQQPQGVTVVAGQTGLGKSHALRTVLADPATPPTLVLAPTTDLVSAFVAAYPADDLGHYRGRSPDPASPGHCLRFPQIEDLRANHRSIAAHECQTCPHGLAASDRPDAQEKLLDALNHELSRGQLDLADPAGHRDWRAAARQVKPCPWVQQRDNLRRYPHAAASHAAYNQDRAQVLTRTTPDQPDRQVVIDESPPLFDDTVITPQTLSQWLAKNTADAPYPPEDLAPAAWLELNQNLDSALRTLAALLGAHPDSDNYRLTPADLDVQPLIATLDAFPRALDGLRPEAVLKDARGARLVVPRRALEDLKTALQLGTAWIHHGSLYLAVPSRSLQEILDHRRAITLTDATPGLLLQALADHYQPLPVSTPSLQLQLHTGRLHGKQSADDPRDLADLIQVMEEHVARQGIGQVGVLTHQTLALLVRQQVEAGRVRGWRPEDSALVGWFGRHDRGHNDWLHLTALIQWGVQRPAPAVLERLYEAERAVAALAGIEWRPWSRERAEQWFALPYATPDGQGLELAATLPVNPDQAAWERDRVTTQAVQTAGRLRAAQRPTERLEVHLYTHYPLAGHGLWLNQVHAPGPRANGQQARDVWRQDLHADCQARYDLARANGAQSRRAVNQFLTAQGLPTLSGTTYQRLLEQASAEAPDARNRSATAFTLAIEAVIAFLLIEPSPHIDELAALALEYAASVDSAVDRLAGLLLARALLAARALPPPAGFSVTGAGPPRAPPTA